jgi:para-nitrobenzyl esterase
MEDDSEGSDKAAGEGEDCLVVNVWTPAMDEQRRPVMVWLHGGGFHFGSASLPLYDGCALSSKGDVVVVGVNHRLGVLGFLHLGDVLGEPYTSSGNAGLLDIAAALGWVRDNIAEFGGDPSSVTLMGQSGGGQKVTTVLSMPAVQGLVHRATCQSGTMLQTGLRMNPAELAAFVLHELELDPGSSAGDLETLLALPVARLVAAGGKAMAELGALAFGPVVDGVVLPDEPVKMMANGAVDGIPLLVGSTSDEFGWLARTDPVSIAIDQGALRAALGNRIGDNHSRTTGAWVDEPIARYRLRMPGASPSQLFSAIFSDFVHIGAIRTADQWLAATSSPVYSYVFAWSPTENGKRTGATHGSELPALFRNLSPRRNTPGGRWVSNLTSECWTSFARSGDPNHPNMPEWPAYHITRRPTMVIDEQCSVLEDPFETIRTVWESIATVH